MAVGDGDRRRFFDQVDHSICALPHGDMVDPYIRRSKDGDAVAVASSPLAKMVDRVPDSAAMAGVNVMYVDAVDDDIINELKGDAGPTGNVDLVAAPINGLVAVHKQLLTEPDSHVSGKYDPQWLSLDHCMA